MSDHPTAAAGDDAKPAQDEQGRGALVGRTLQGKYLLEALLGEGTSSAVYRARRADLDKPVAVKVLARSTRADDAERFLREARVGAVVKHPGIAEVFDYGADDGLHFFAMELCEGEPLSARLAREGRLPADEAVAIAASIASALGAVHAKGYVHGDLKPTNVFLVPSALGGRDVKLVDFGLATPVDTTELRRTLHGLGLGERATMPDRIFGTPSYMSPEQALGEGVDRRADVYALGGVLYEMLTGTPPFVSLDVARVVAGHLSELPEPPSSRAPDAGIAPALDAVVLRALAKDREARPESAAELSRALWGALAAAKRGLDAIGAPERAPVAPPADRRRTRALAITATAAAVVLAAAALAGRASIRRSPPAPAAPLATLAQTPAPAPSEPSATPSASPTVAPAVPEDEPAPSASAARPRAVARAATTAAPASSAAAAGTARAPDDFRVDDLKTPFR
jgi:serine/threonine-protein kinase